ncbi:MAG: hypothetical protein MH204_06750 [Fimbriimonadaceae bacterium]|nr:hypothetical protein [Fimbriimonadaceae bacterium]
MKTSFLKAIAVASLALAASLSMAQGRPGGMGMGMMMQGGGMGDAMLLNSPDVQKDLKLTDEQKSKLEAIRTEAMAGFGGGRGQGGQRPQGQAQGGQAQGGQRPGAVDWQARMRELNDKTMAVLTDAQKARLKQIGIQVAGGRALMRDDVQKDLDLRAAQKQQLKALNDSFQAGMMTMFQQMRDGSMSREDMQATIERNNKILDAEAVKVLTPEQKTKFEAMKGPKFEGQVVQMGFGGGRQGGGRQGGGRQGGGGQGGARPPAA